MKNETNTRNSQGGIPRICAIALSISLFASLHAEAVTPQLNGNGSPGVSVSFSSPAGGGFSSSGDYMHVNAIAVYAVPKNGDPSWSSLQKVVVDWYLYFFDPQKGWTRWDTQSLTNLGTWVGTTWTPASPDYVAFASSSGYVYKPARVFPKPVPPGYYYTVVMRVAWLNSANGQPMASALYWFNKVGDLQCVNATTNCSLYTAYWPGGSPDGKVQALYFRY